MRRGFLTCVAVLVLLPACASSQRRASNAGEPVSAPDANDLERRAARLWTARTAEDWATVFRFEDPQRRAQMVEAEFVAWCQQNEPFDIHEFHIKGVETTKQFGWVEVDYRTSVRQFPKMPPRDVTRWEKWRITEGEWYPVSRRELGDYPEAPARRNSAEEARLLKRFEESWRARHERDWEGLYALTDPHDREHVTQEEFVEKESVFEHLAYELEWIEVIGDRGRVRVSYTAKLNDPSMTKLPPQTAPAIERWIKCDNDWYLDLGATPR